MTRCISPNPSLPTGFPARSRYKDQKHRPYCLQMQSRTVFFYAYHSPFLPLAPGCGPLLCLPGVYRPLGGGCPGSTGRQGHPPPRAGQLRQPGRPGPQALRPGPNLGPDHPAAGGGHQRPGGRGHSAGQPRPADPNRPGSHRGPGVRLFRLGPSGGNLVPHPAVPGRGPPRRELPSPAGAHR